MPKLGLLQKIKNMEPAKTTGSSWHEHLRATNPEGYAELIEVILDFLDKGDTFIAFRGTTELYLYLSGQHTKYPLENAPVKVSVNSFKNLVQGLKNGSIQRPQAFPEEPVTNHSKHRQRRS